MEYHSIIIDASNMAYRSWWAVRDLRCSDGRHTGLEYGFLKNLLSQAREHMPAKVVLAWDGAPTRRTEIYPEYKAGREQHEDKKEEAPWGPRLDRLRNVLGQLCLNLYEADQEADDLMAQWARTQEQQGNKTLLVTNDQDLHQMVSESTHLWPWKDEALDVAAITEKWGAPPHKLPFIRAISGDTSDNIKGVPRIPAKIKQQLANDANTIDELIRLFYTATYFRGTQQQKLKDGCDIVRRNYRLMNLRDDDVIIDNYEYPPGDSSAALDLCRDLELQSLYERKEWELFRESQTIHAGGPDGA